MGLGTNDPFNTATILFSGQDRFAKRDGDYFQNVQVYQHHTGKGATGINVYSFGLKPDKQIRIPMEISKILKDFRTINEEL